MSPVLSLWWEYTLSGKAHLCRVISWSHATGLTASLHHPDPIGQSCQKCGLCHPLEHCEWENAKGQRRKDKDGPYSVFKIQDIIAQRRNNNARGGNK